MQTIEGTAAFLIGTLRTHVRFQMHSQFGCDGGLSFGMPILTRSWGKPARLEVDRRPERLAFETLANRFSRKMQDGGKVTLW
jgi:hypothetical protein